MNKPKVGIFVDDSNLFYAQKKAGWRVDPTKLKQLFSKEVEVEFINYYIAVPKITDPASKNTQKYLDHLKRHPVTIISKPLKYIKSGNTYIKKGDVDLELALDVTRLLENLDIILVVSGDSDYLELRRYVIQHDKQIVFLGFRHNLAWEIKQGKYILLEQFKKFLDSSEKTTPKLAPGRILLDLLKHKEK